MSDDAIRMPEGYYQITDLSGAVTLLAGLTNYSCRALIQAEDQDVRWRDDGTAPTAAAGMLLCAGESMWYCGDIRAIQFIEVAASAKLNVSFYK